MSNPAAASPAVPQQKLEQIHLSDDECVHKLAALIELRDSSDLAEIAKLIGRLAVPVE
jgi:hypothetical protein